MVFYFTSKVVDPPAQIYMGKDKFENEDLIKYGWEEDVWFHVDRLSSAHVYLRMTPGQTWDNLPDELVQDLAQLTKANSIEGNKKDNITVIYTPWSNLKKTQGMETGQVTFFKEKLVKKVKVEKRVNEIVNRLNKTKEERYPDLEAEKLKKKRGERIALRSAEREKKEREMETYRRKKEEEDAKSYKNVMDERKMKSNAENFKEDVADEREVVDAFEEDFM